MGVSPDNRKRSPQILAKAALLCGGLVVGLAVAEAGVRLAGIDAGIHVIYRENFQLSDNPVLKYELRPGSRDGRHTINSAGMRDTEYPEAKPDEIYRIVIVGDSVTYGLTVGPRQAFPEQLEQLLAARLPASLAAQGLEVLNLGVSGYNIEQVVERLRTLGLSYDPDLVIYAYSLNDSQTFSLELQGLSAMRKNAEQTYTPERSLLRWLSHSRAFMLAWRSFQEPWTRPAKPAKQSPDYLAVVSGRHADYFGALHEGQGWERIEEGFGKLARLGQSSEASPRVLLAVMPMHLAKETDYPLAALHQKIIAEADRQGLETLDLAPALMPDGPNTQSADFNDPFHPSPRGHRRVALALLGWLEENIPQSQPDGG